MTQLEILLSWAKQRRDSARRDALLLNKQADTYQEMVNEVESAIDRINRGVEE